MTQKKDIIQLITEGIQERKGKKITILDLGNAADIVAGRFVICEGNSPTQVSAIADSVREYVQEHGDIKPYNYDGYQNSQWIVIDYGDTFVHVFLPETRRLYNLEELWSDADIREIPDLD